ncbi:hypothetical protein BJV82DRAFT_661850 [Fennellomyces sp. T-0311]|nr:hypothetical protein BJV82DRAFT_661850 [Fennellomyces sp. T-0311]
MLHLDKANLPVSSKLLSSASASGSSSPSQAQRNATPDLRDPLRRHYSLLSPRRTPASPHRTSSEGQFMLRSPLRRTQTAIPAESVVESSVTADPRRTRSLDSLGAVQKADTTQPWRREHWITLSRYYEAVGRDIEQTVKVFYRHESLQFEETENGSQQIVESWSKERIRWHVRCLDAVTKKHHGKPLLERIRAFELKKKRKGPISKKNTPINK